MTIPTIRVDICFYYIIISILAIGMLYTRVELENARSEIHAINDRLANSAVVDMREIP